MHVAGLPRTRPAPSTLKFARRASHRLRVVEGDMLCVWLAAAPALTIPRVSLGAAAAVVPAVGAAGVFFVKRRRATNERQAAEVREHLLSLTPVSSDTVSVDETGTIKGRGLYARAALEPNTYLFDFTGELLEEEAYRARYPEGVDADYVVCVGKQKGSERYIDAADEGASGVARFMNHARQQPNCVCFTMEEPPRAMLYTIEPVEVGDELVWDYGEGYWRDRPTQAELQE